MKNKIIYLSFLFILFAIQQNSFAINFPDNLENKSNTSIILVGDISFSRGIARTIANQKDITFPFKKIEDYLKNSDAVFGNLESPITKGRQIATKEMIFRADPGVEAALSQANFKILNLANNHILNFGKQGLIDTINYLQKSNIKYIGASINSQDAYKPVFIDNNNLKIAIIGCADRTFAPPNSLIAIMDSEKIYNAISEAKKQANFVIVSMHSGDEYQKHPNSVQINFAHKAIDAGADLVVGHHPHVIQSIEKYRNKYIFYSLGNFVFDQKFSEKVRNTLMIKLNFSGTNLTTIDLLPLFINNYYQPEVANDNLSKKNITEINFNEIETKPFFIIDNKNGHITEGSHYFIEIKKDEHVNTSRTIYKNFDLELEKGMLSIYQKNKIIWQTPSDYKVDSVSVADITNSGEKTINFSLWKSHNFGNSKPFWIKNDKTNPHNHFFIYHYIDGKFKPIWGSSNLDQPNCKFVVRDINYDGKNELITLEGKYQDYPNCHGKDLAIWQWNGWGFNNLWRSSNGKFSDFKIEKINNQNVIFVY